MKGPGMRLDLDIRRVWQCPACGREARSQGDVIAKVCGCTKDGTAMRLLERPRPKPTIRIPEPSEPEEPELADFPTDIPVNPPRMHSPKEDQPEIKPPMHEPPDVKPPTKGPPEVEPPAKEPPESDPPEVDSAEIHPPGEGGIGE